MEVAKRILQLREERQWSEYRLAKEAGISQSTLSNLICQAGEITRQSIRWKRLPAHSDFLLLSSLIRKMKTSQSQ